MSSSSPSAVLVPARLQTATTLPSAAPTPLQRQRPDALAHQALLTRYGAAAPTTVTHPTLNTAGVSTGERVINGISQFIRWVRSNPVNELVTTDFLSMVAPRTMLELFLRPFNKLTLARETLFREMTGLITMGPLSGWFTGGASQLINSPSNPLNPKGVNTLAHFNLNMAHHGIQEAYHGLDQHAGQPLETFRKAHIRHLISQLEPTDLPQWQHIKQTHGLTTPTHLGEPPEVLLKLFDRSDSLKHFPTDPIPHHEASKAFQKETKAWTKQALEAAEAWGLTEKVQLRDAAGNIAVGRRSLANTLTDIRHYAHEVLDRTLATTAQAGHDTLTPEAIQHVRHQLADAGSDGLLPHMADSWLGYLNKQRTFTATIPILMVAGIATIPTFANAWITKRQNGGKDFFPAEQLKVEGPFSPTKASAPSQPHPVATIPLTTELVAATTTQPTPPPPPAPITPTPMVPTFSATSTTANHVWIVPSLPPLTNTPAHP